MAGQTGIIIIGAEGRMGKTIRSLVELEPAFHLAGLVESREKLGKLKADCPCSDDLSSVIAKAPNAVIIDFTAPAATLKAAQIAAKARMPMVMGTTGFTEEQKRELASVAKSAPMLWSANMSIGVNVLLDILPRLARALGPAYDMEIMELHHRRKKDAPSGTALMLADALASARDWSLAETRCSQRDGITGERPEREIGVQALRGGDVVGIHNCYFLGPGEIIEVSHQAESRENFAQGALRAAQWLKDQKAGKLYSMQDVIHSAISD